MKKTVCCFLMFACIVANAQNTIGLPDIINYSKQQFQGGSQTWDIQTDSRGIMYFANNDGLLTFNGKYWKLYPVPNHTRVRSIAIDKNGKIYVGAQDEFGYFFPDASGDLKYTSLKNLIPQQQKQFADIWHIVLHDDGVLFRSADRIFHLKDNAIRIYNAPAEWRFLCKAGNRMYAQDLKAGLLLYENNTWNPICVDFAQKNMLITAIMAQADNSLIITTLKDGIFTFSNGQLSSRPSEADPIFYSSRIYCAVALPNGQIAVGTTSNGCIIIDAAGKIIQSFAIPEGLQNNNVLKIFTDSNQNLWLGLDYGIDLIRYNTAIRHISPDKSNLLTTYAAHVFNNRLYIGTSDGLYSSVLNDPQADFSFSKNPFLRVNNTKGQTWNLTEINQHLLLGHHEGTFDIKDNTAEVILKDVGSWLYYPLSPVSPSSQVLIGTYNGLRLLPYADNKFGYATQLEGLWESLRFMAIDNDNTIWASHPYRGVYKITQSGESVSSLLYTQEQGLPSTLDNYVFRIKNKVVIATEKGIYEFDPSTNKFMPSPLLHPILGNTAINYLKEDQSGNIWFVTNKKVGVIDFQKPTDKEAYSIIYFPELKGKTVGGFELIYPYNAENVFIGSEKGIYHLNYKKYTKYSPELTVLLGQIKSTGKTDSLIFGGYFANKQQLLATQDNKNIIDLPNTYNNFHFEFAAPAYEQDAGIEFSYQLKGYDKGWSDWTQKTEKEYTNLSAGHYSFIVKARNNLGVESKQVTYAFDINPAWHQTWWAYGVYMLLFLSFIYYIYKRQKKKFAAQKVKHEKEQQDLVYLHQLEIDRNEKELIKLQNDKLESDVQFKNKELATATMHLVERGKVLTKIREELEQALKKSEVPVSGTQFKRVLRLFDEAENNADDWEHFSTHFDQVHSNFLARLKAIYPQLTATDLKLCAYLRINLTSKEIAQLMGITVRGVEISRYRLRKKLNLSGDDTLFDFLLVATNEGNEKD